MKTANSASLEPRHLNRDDLRTLALAALGGALEFYDFVIFVFFTKALGHLFFPATMPEWMSQLQVYGIFAAGYLARPLGGIVMAHFGDRSGRKRMFTLSVFLMALPTLCIGLLPTYAVAGVLAPLLLLLLRIVQGVAIGGEIPGAWVFVAEHVPPGRVGIACASLTSGLTLGILIGSLIAKTINTHLTPDEVLAYGWRIPFILGGAFGFIAVYLRRWLQETPVFTAMRERRGQLADLPIREVVTGHLPAVLLSFLLGWVITAAIVVVILLTPTLLQTVFHLDAALTFTGNSIAAACLTMGCLLGGWLADRIGRALALLIAAAGLLLSTYAFFIDLTAGAQHFLPLYALAGLFAGVVGIVPSIMVGVFPPAIRFSGISFSYNIAYALFGALTPPLVAYLVQTAGPLAPAHYVAVVAAIGMAVGLYLLITRYRFEER